MSVMMLTREQIKSAALQLAPADREALAEELLLSIGESDRQAIEAAWVAEAHRRDADFRAGRTGAKPAGQVIDRLLTKPRPTSNAPSIITSRSAGAWAPNSWMSSVAPSTSS